MPPQPAAGPSNLNNKTQTVQKKAALTSELFKGEKIAVAEGQFEASRGLPVNKLIELTGATPTSDETDATIILVHPSSTHYRSDKYPLSRTKTTHPLIVPYHYLGLCKQANERLSPTSLEPPRPFFIHPDRSFDHAPLRVWVSVNLHRYTEATPHEAQAVVQAQIERVGGLVVEKRAAADLLIVDRSTGFYQTCLQEHKCAGRHWQRFAERDWVDDCVKKGKLVWPSMEVDTEKDADSMAEEDDPPVKGTGPGRPPGAPRNEYSPDDDDFMCRWIAAHPSAGAPGSRKTFGILVDSHEKYPLAKRHSAQSWHERFKKGSAVYSKRVARFREAGIDESLRTKEERAKAREIRKELEKQKEEAAARAAESAVDNSAGSIVAPTSSSSEPKIPGTGQSIKPTSTAQKEGARLTELASEAVQPVVTAAVAQANQQDTPASASSKRASAVPARSPRGVRRQARAVLVEPDSEDEVQKEVLRPAAPAVSAKLQDAPAASTSRPPPADSTKRDGAQSDNAPTSEKSATTVQAAVPAIPDTRAAGEAASSTTRAIEMPAPSEVVATHEQREVVSQEVAVTITKPEQRTTSAATPAAPGAVTSAHGDTDASRTLNADGPAGHLAPATPVLPSRSVSQSHPSPNPSSARSPKKVRIEVDDAREHDEAASSGPPAPDRDVFRPRHSVPAQHAPSMVTPERGILISGAQSYTPRTTTPLKRTLVQDLIATSERKRRSSEHGSRRKSRSSMIPQEEPDTVMASTKFPAAQLHTAPEHIPPPRPAPPRVSPEENAQMVEKGREVVQRQQDEYRRHIERLCALFGVMPGELVRAVNEIPRAKKRVGEMYWKDVEAELRSRFRVGM